MAHFVLRLASHQGKSQIQRRVHTTRKRGSTPAFRCTTRVLGWHDSFCRLGYLEGEFTPMPSPTRLARFCARARRCARSAPENRKGVAPRSAVAFSTSKKYPPRCFQLESRWCFFCFQPGPVLLKTFQNAMKMLKTVRFVLFEKTRGNGAKNGALQSRD